MEQNEIINHLRQYKKKNQDRYTIKRLGVFGSAARGTLMTQSDIDIVVELEKPDLFYIIGIKQDLEESLHRSVDVVRYRKKMNEFFKRRIDKEALYV
jgi:predicted nucleotidyltransferase